MFGRWYPWCAAGVVAGGALLGMASLTAWPTALTTALAADPPKASRPVAQAAPAKGAAAKAAPRAAAQNAATDKAAQTPVRAARPLEITPEREAIALSFAQEHHPEMAALLGHLKRSNKRQYERAIRELFRTSERLAQAKERDDARYELDLEIWKVESQIRLLVARLTMSPGDVEMQEKLRSLLMERVDLRIRRQRMDRDRLAARVQRLDENIASLESEREALVDQSYAKLIESVSTFGIQPQRRSPAAAAASKTDPATNKPENKRPN
mgnify:CR=1 FL=1